MPRKPVAARLIASTGVICWEVQQTRPSHLTQLQARHRRRRDRPWAQLHKHGGRGDCRGHMAKRDLHAAGCVLGAYIQGLETGRAPHLIERCAKIPRIAPCKSRYGSGRKERQAAYDCALCGSVGATVE
jgi:hypothetical protein